MVQRGWARPGACRWVGRACMATCSRVPRGCESSQVPEQLQTGPEWPGVPVSGPPSCPACPSPVLRLCFCEGVEIPGPSRPLGNWGASGTPLNPPLAGRAPSCSCGLALCPPPRSCGFAVGWSVPDLCSGQARPWSRGWSRRRAVTTLPWCGCLPLPRHVPGVCTHCLRSQKTPRD